MNEVLLKELISLANDLDKAGLSKEADKVDKLIKEANPLLLIGAIALCFAGACKKVSKEELNKVGLDWTFIYENEDDELPYDVNPVCGGGPGLGEHTDTSCAGKDSLGNHITLTWGCGDFELYRDLMHLDTGDELNNVYISISWQLNEDGYIMNEEVVSAEMHTC